MDKIVLGIGNPGAKYAHTRHNLGFRVIDILTDLHGEKFRDSRFKSLAAKVKNDQCEFLLVKPLTYVNLSGECARAILDWYKLTPSSLLVVTDDLSLPPGKIRIRKKGSSSGHRGMESIIRCLGTEEFPRLRIGIGGDVDGPVANYVLSNFTPEENAIIENSVRLASEAVMSWIESGIETAMNQYNSMKTEKERE